jgi:hypothetical protein
VYWKKEMKQHAAVVALAILICILGISRCSSQARALQHAAPPDWSAFQFLLGNWTGEGSGNPGQGTGRFTFSLDLDNHIMIRNSQSDYPETKEHPAFSHRDKMIVFQESGSSPHAMYFDNEGHTIRYSIDVSVDRKSITFISDSIVAGPRFKLTYASLAGESLLIMFEIAPPGPQARFTKYLEGRAVKMNVHPSIGAGKK